MFALFRLDQAITRIDEQDKQIKEQQDLIEQKETFGAAMEDLMNTASAFDGVLVGDLVPWSSYESLARLGYSHRWNADALADDIEAAKADATKLQAKIDAAAVEATTNTTGTTFETVTDQLGQGYVASLLEDADTFCESDVLACVDWDDPYTVHFDAADNSVEYMTDWLRTGIAYHEFAHVLQITNPDETETAVAAFGGDDETMADCFALTYLDGWTLHHTIWVSDFQYWEVDIGYGYTCDDSQRQVIRDWYSSLGFHVQPIEQ